MKARFFLIPALLLTLFGSCQKDDIGIEHAREFNASLNTWQTFKKSSGNTYQYTTVHSAVWAGIAWQTDIKVSEGKVIQRHFKYLVANQSNIPQDKIEWTENENEINSHQNTGAADPLTLDQIYEKARNQWLLKRPDADVYFEAKNNGLISTAGYWKKGCQDDCFIGINISSIQN